MKFQFKSEAHRNEFKSRFAVNKEICDFLGSHLTIFSGEPNDDGDLTHFTSDKGVFSRGGQTVFSEYEIERYLDDVEQVSIRDRASLVLRNAETDEIKALELQIRSLETKLERAKQRLHKARHDL